MAKTNNDYLKKKQSKKDLEIGKYRRRSKALMIILIIMIGFFALTFIQDLIIKLISTPSVGSLKNYTTMVTTQNGTISCPDPTLTSGFTKGLFGFMDKLFTYPGGFWTKFFIFLGIVYLIQVLFSLVFDIIELVLLAFVGVKRLVMWLYYKITGKSKQDKQLKKVLEL